MPAATNQQVQTYVNERTRPRCEQIRNLYELAKGDKATIDDVYTALNVQSPTWSDNRTDGPPHLASPSDVLGWNAFVTDLITFIEGHGQWPVVQRLCVRNIVG